MVYEGEGRSLSLVDGLGGWFVQGVREVEKEHHKPIRVSH